MSETATPRPTPEIENRDTLLCEGCGVEVPMRPWPEGWYQTGKSERRGRWSVPRTEGKPAEWKPSVACWCSDNCYSLHQQGEAVRKAMAAASK